MDEDKFKKAMKKAHEEAKMLTEKKLALAKLQREIDEMETTDRDVLQKTPFLEAFGDTPKTRILIFLMAHRYKDYTMDEIGVFAGVKAWKTVSTCLQSLIRFGFVEESRKIGKSQMFSICDGGVGIVKALFGVNQFLVDVIIEEETQNMESKEY